jgi:hypothetical protein
MSIVYGNMNIQFIMIRFVGRLSGQIDRMTRPRACELRQLHHVGLVSASCDLDLQLKGALLGPLDQLLPPVGPGDTLACEPQVPASSHNREP